MNDSISAKLGNVLESENDVNTSEIAIKKITESMKEYKKTGDRGILGEKNRILNELGRKLENSKSIEDSIEKRKESIEELNSEIKAMLDLKNKNQETINKINEQERKKAKNETYKTILDNVKKDEGQKDKIIKFFKGEVISNEKIEEITAEYLRIETLKNEIKNLNIDDEKLKRYLETEKMFKEEKISKESMEYCISLLNENTKYEALIKENDNSGLENNVFSKLEELFEGKGINESSFDECINKYNEIQSVNSKIEENKLRKESNLKLIEKNKQRMKKNKTKMIGLLVLFSVFMLLGIILVNYKYKIGFASSGISIIILVLAIVQLVKNKQYASKYVSINNDKEEIEKALINLTDKKEKIEKELENFLYQFDISTSQNNILIQLTGVKAQFIKYKSICETLNLKQEKILEYKSIQNNNIAKIDYVISRFYTYYNCKDKFELCKIISKELEKNEFISKNIEKKEALNQELNIIQKKLKEIMTRYFENVEMPFLDMIDEIKKQKNEFLRISKQIEEDINLKRQYEQNNDIEELAQLSEISEQLEKVNKQEVIKELLDLDKKINLLNDEKNNQKNQIEIMENTLDSVQDVESDIERLRLEIKEAEEKYRILEQTKKLLEKAKENFTSHYLGKMSNKFNQYTSMINNGKIDTNIDVNLDIKIESHGTKRAIDYFSAGYKDIFGICMRFALVDSLFEEETPFIILDDPFVNLDGEKLNRAKELIEKISKRYQIIYFICHESRK